MLNEDLKYLIPYSGTVLIIFGAIKLITFFSFFGVNITPYLDFTEILTLFLNNIIAFGSVFLILNFILFLISPKSIDEESAINIENSTSEKKIYKRLKYYNGTGPIDMLTITIGLILIGIILLFINKSKIWDIITIGGALWIGFLIKVLVLEVRRQYIIKYEKYPKAIYLQMFLIFVVLLAMTLRTAYKEYDNIKNKKINTGTEITLSNVKITSTKQYYYILNTRNYVFFYDEKNKSCDIFPMAEVKKITLKNSR